MVDQVQTDLQKAELAAQQAKEGVVKAESWIARHAALVLIGGVILAAIIIVLVVGKL